MPTVRLRDRDAIVTKENIVFRVLGYSHPADAYVCDAEYASSEIFKSQDPRAPRTGRDSVFYKFYDDEGWNFVQNKYPQHTFHHEMLGKRIVGVNHSRIADVRRPDERFRELVRMEHQDTLVEATRNVVKLVSAQSRFSTDSFGVFGSLLHGFHHPKFSDIDLVVYGARNISCLRETLQELYSQDLLLGNEFENINPATQKSWRFLNYTAQEYVLHQRRKLTYGVFHGDKRRRAIKVEFEPVKDWSDIVNEYDPRARITQKGWVKMCAHVTGDFDAPFVPSIYEIEPLKVLHGVRHADGVKRVVSYMEEFRLQACKDETVYVEGNLEEVMAPNESFFQVVLTYCPRYYEQVLKSVDSGRTF